MIILELRVSVYAYPSLIVEQPTSNGGELLDTLTPFHMASSFTYTINKMIIPR